MSHVLNARDDDVAAVVGYAPMTLLQMAARPTVAHLIRHIRENKRHDISNQFTNQL